MNRTISLSAFSDEIYKDFIKNKDTNYIFLLGAGCSKSSGIPLAGELAFTRSTAPAVECISDSK